MGSNARMRPMESELQSKDAAFSGGRPSHEALESNAQMRQLKPQWQQKKAAFSIGNNMNHE